VVAAIIRLVLSEWLRIMLEEIARKDAAADLALREEQSRDGEPARPPAPAADRATG
jgi:hypothetical protein